MLRHRLSRLLPAATTLATLATPALAQDLSPIQTMLETVEAALTGPIGIAVSTLAVIGVDSGRGQDRITRHFGGAV